MCEPREVLKALSMAPRTLQIKSDAADQHQSQNGTQYKIQCGAKNQHSIQCDVYNSVSVTLHETALGNVGIVVIVVTKKSLALWVFAIQKYEM